MKDPKTSRWLWDIRERSRQKKRTENYRSIIAMQQSASFSGGADGEGGTNPQVMEDMTRLTDKQQMANFLTWGKWDLDNSAIEKLVKDEERKERVGSILLLIFSQMHKLQKFLVMLQIYQIQCCYSW